MVSFRSVGLVFGVGAALLTIGCGGSGGGTPTAGGGGGENRLGFGPLQGRGVLRGFVDTIGTTLTTATAIPGTFTELNLIQQGTSVAESLILSGKGGFLRAWQGDGTNERALLPGRFAWFSGTKDGRYVFATEFRTGQPARIVRIDMWNNTLLPITAPASNQNDLYVNVVDNQSGIVFIRETTGQNDRVVRTGLAGGTLTTIRSLLAGDYRYPAIFDNTLYYWVNNTSYTGPAIVGGTDTNSIGFTNLDLAAYSANGLNQATVNSFSGTFYVRVWANYRTDSSFGARLVAELPSGTEFSDLMFSPDNRELLYVTNQGSDTQPDPLRALNLQTGAFRSISLNIISVINAGLGWVTGRTFFPLIGSTVDHFLGTGSDGVIFTRQDERATGIVSFDATTPSSVVMKAETGGNPNPDTLSYSVDADAISLVRFANGPVFTPVNVVGTGAQIATCTGFLVDFDNDTGRVGLILPYTAQRGVSRSVTSEGSTKLFRGEFLGVLDGKGKNLAPSGAREVRVSGGRVEVR